CRPSSPKRLPVLPRRPAFWRLSAQATRPALPFGTGARLALQLVLRTPWLPHTQDATVAAVSRAEGLCGGSSHSYYPSARGRDANTDAAAQRAYRCRPPESRTLAQVVAGGVYGNAILASGACCVHAASR